MLDGLQGLSSQIGETVSNQLLAVSRPLDEIEKVVGNNGHVDSEQLRCGTPFVLPFQMLSRSVIRAARIPR